MHSHSRNLSYSTLGQRNDSIAVSRSASQQYDSIVVNYIRALPTTSQCVDKESESPQ